MDSVDRQAITPIVKEKLPKPRPLDTFQKLLRNDLIGIDVRAIEWRNKPVCFGRLSCQLKDFRINMIYM